MVVRTGQTAVRLEISGPHAGTRDDPIEPGGFGIKAIFDVIGDDWDGHSWRHTALTPMEPIDPRGLAIIAFGTELFNPAYELAAMVDDFALRIDFATHRDVEPMRVYASREIWIEGGRPVYIQTVHCDDGKLRLDKLQFHHAMNEWHVVTHDDKRRQWVFHGTAEALQEILRDGPMAHPEDLQPGSYFSLDSHHRFQITQLSPGGQLVAIAAPPEPKAPRLGVSGLKPPVFYPQAGPANQNNDHMRATGHVWDAEHHVWVKK